MQRYPPNPVDSGQAGPFLNQEVGYVEQGRRWTAGVDGQMEGAVALEVGLAQGRLLLEQCIDQIYF